MSPAVVALGALLALLLVLLLRRRPPPRERRGYAMALLVAAAVYVGFALAAPHPYWLLVEGAGLGLFGAVAWLGLRRSAWWLSVGWLAHVGWDLLHGGGHAAFVPGWYPALCAGFDPVIALAIPLSLRRRAHAPAEDRPDAAHAGPDVDVADPGAGQV